MSLQELEAVKKELADISAFVKERGEGRVKDETDRLSSAVESLVESSKETRRNDLLVGSDSHARRVEAGPYVGCDALDMAIVRSLHKASHAFSASTGSERWAGRIKAAMDSVTAAGGDELVATSEASQLWNDVNLETMVASLFSRISMPTTPFDIPLQLGDVNWYPGSENVSAKSTALTTGKQTLTAHELVAEVPWSLSLEEDAVIAMLPEVRRTLVRNAAEVIDDVLLNGDTSATNGINSDGATITSTTPGKAHWLVGFDGLLHLPLVDNTSQANNLNGSVTAASYNQALKMLGKYGVRNNESVFITDVNTYLSSLALDEVETVDKLGPAATILTGQLGVVYGHPLIVSEQMRLADTDGKVTDGATGTTGRILATNRSQWRVGFRRELSIETERDIQKRQNVMVVSMRIALSERTGARASATHTALQYNVTGVV
ncbi:MAG: phage major capsid protein [Chloroflexi bacterium]|jgi:HK97 family phage major capsid protein|nr:phage major capsid protein [Chloroflexota bacterium]MBT5628283.1 phage major capsid protein [Chloroflexota bacterium]